MTENEVLQGLIIALDEAYDPKKWWLEVGSDLIFKVAIENGFVELKKFDAILAKEFISLGEAFLIADKEGMVDEAADLAAQLFKVLVFKKN